MFAPVRRNSVSDTVFVFMLNMDEDKIVWTLTPIQWGVTLITVLFCYFKTGVVFPLKDLTKVFGKDDLKHLCQIF